MPKFISKAEKARRLAVQINNYRRKYPKRWAFWHRAMLGGPQPCEVCGAEARPWFEPHPSVVMLGWRCYGCRPNAQKPPPAEASGGS
jgi:hypothetical protein